MKKINLFTTLFVFTLFITAASVNLGCKKDRIEVPEEEEEELNEYESVNDYLDSKKQEEQTFEITGPSNDTIVGNQGTRIYGMKSCLRDANGDTIDYPFNVHLVELYTPKDMIYWQMPTIANGNILETDGEVRIRSTKDGEDLGLDCPFSFEMPNSAPDADITIFKGNDNGNFVDWTNTSNSFTITSYGYLGTTNSFGWLGAHKQIGNGAGSTITFDSEVDNLTNVGIFIYIPASKTVMQVYNLTSGVIADGTIVKIVLMAKDASGQLFSYTDIKTMNGSTTMTVSLTETTDTDLTNYLDAL